MNKQDTLLAKKIAAEYISFTRKTSRMIEEVKRATIFSLKKVLKLKDGDIILIKEDGSLEIEEKTTKEKE
jgi:hypothetical protein